MSKGKYLTACPRRREARRAVWMGELVLGNLGLALLWAGGYIHPVPAMAMAAVFSARLGYRLGRHR